MAAEAGNAPNMEAKAWKWGLELEDKFTDRYAKIEQSVMKQAGNITKAIEGNGAAVTKMENAVEHAATSVARSSVKVESALSRQATAALSGLSGVAKQIGSQMEGILKLAPGGAKSEWEKVLGGIQTSVSEQMESLTKTISDSGPALSKAIEDAAKGFGATDEERIKHPYERVGKAVQDETRMIKELFDASAREINVALEKAQLGTGRVAGGRELGKALGGVGSGVWAALQKASLGVSEAGVAQEHESRGKAGGFESILSPEEMMTPIERAGRALGGLWRGVKAAGRRMVHPGAEVAPQGAGAGVGAMPAEQKMTTMERAMERINPVHVVSAGTSFWSGLKTILGGRGEETVEGRRKRDNEVGFFRRLGDMIGVTKKPGARKIGGIIGFLISAVKAILGPGFDTMIEMLKWQWRQVILPVKELFAVVALRLQPVFNGLSQLMRTLGEHIIPSVAKGVSFVANWMSGYLRKWAEQLNRWLDKKMPEFEEWVRGMQRDLKEWWTGTVKPWWENEIIPLWKDKLYPALIEFYEVVKKVIAILYKYVSDESMWLQEQKNIRFWTKEYWENAGRVIDKAILGWQLTVLDSSERIALGQAKWWDWVVWVGDWVVKTIGEIGRIIGRIFMKGVDVVERFFNQMKEFSKWLANSWIGRRMGADDRSREEREQKKAREAVQPKFGEWLQTAEEQVLEAMRKRTAKQYAGRRARLLRETAPTLTLRDAIALAQSAAAGKIGGDISRFNRWAVGGMKLQEGERATAAFKGWEESGRSKEWDWGLAMKEKLKMGAVDAWLMEKAVKAGIATDVQKTQWKQYQQQGAMDVEWKGDKRESEIVDMIKSREIKTQDDMVKLLEQIKNGVKDTAGATKDTAAETKKTNELSTQAQEAAAFLKKIEGRDANTRAVIATALKMSSADTKRLAAGWA